MKIIKFLKKILTGKVVQEVYLAKDKENWTKDEKYAQHEKEMRRAIQNLTKQVQDYQKKINLKKQIKEEEKEEKRLKEDIFRGKQLEERLKKSKTVWLKPRGLRRYPKLYSKRDNYLGRYAGFYLHQTKEGDTLWSPVVKVKGKGIKMLTVYSNDPRKYFRNQLNVPEQMKSGKLDTNIDFTTNGNLKIFDEESILNELAKKEYGDNVKVIPLGQSERQEYERKIESFKDQLNTLFSQLKELKDKEVNYEIKLNDIETSNAYLTKDRDIQTAHSENLIQKSAKLVESNARQMVSNQELLLNQIATEKMNNSLWDINEDLIQKIAKYVPEDRRGQAIREATETLVQGIKLAREAGKPNKIVIQSEKEAKKEEKK